MSGKGRAAKGAGTIRKKTVTKNGKPYTYWEARITVGRDPGTGKQIQRSFTGKTQKDVREKMQTVAVEINTGSYTAPSKMTVGEWMDIWEAEYLGGVKPLTAASYQRHIKNHIKPALGAVKLEQVKPHMIQALYNRLGEKRGDQPGLSPKTIKNLHGVLHKAFQQAVKLEYLRYNPTDACELPRVERKEIVPLDSEKISRFLTSIKGHVFEVLFTVTLFTGMRLGEVLGLMWNCVDFKSGTITVNKQLQAVPGGHGEYRLISTKNRKGRVLTPAPFVMELLKRHRAAQLAQRLKIGPLWEDSGLVFTNETGRHLVPVTVYKHFKRIAASIGVPASRFHDLRHSYAVAALQAGDDIKTLQDNLGHHAAAFTLDIYGHVTQKMKQASANRMEQYIKEVSNL